MSNYETLANAIILQAVRDWRDACRISKSYPEIFAEGQKQKDIERFFRSSWFGVLTNVDGRLLLRKLQEEQAS
ncbi:MAG: hypothetical protein MR711_13100 [Selenomonas sp.]|uniref:hypothetical protein n=1 Tax=Selenomonas sp. TaxID=2053611 RepID=UPI0025DE77E9|nr:hypothetical protein [Selenomonas sp.]MCI6087155.1 hypothetical protein [Selenomonas sp.]MDY4417472.1 hypothetical protein [Selenomonas sp.]